jgi:hypothetical protein
MKVGSDQYNKYVGTLTCQCYCVKTYPQKDFNADIAQKRRRCLSMCGGGENNTDYLCGGDAGCNPKKTGKGSTDDSCGGGGTVGGQSCKGKCDGGNYCDPGCACLVVDDPARLNRDKTCECQMNAMQGDGL